MKLKSRPEDFRVTELAEWDEDPQGDHRVYRITKTKMTTFEAVDRIREAVGLSGEGVSYAGLKDKQAVKADMDALGVRPETLTVNGLPGRSSLSSSTLTTKRPTAVGLYETV